GFHTAYSATLRLSSAFASRIRSSLQGIEEKLQSSRLNLLIQVIVGSKLDSYTSPFSDTYFQFPLESRASKSVGGSIRTPHSLRRFIIAKKKKSFERRKEDLESMSSIQGEEREREKENSEGGNEVREASVLTRSTSERSS